VWVMNADGSSPHPITHHHGNRDVYFQGAWTADGKYISYGHIRYVNGGPVTMNYIRRNTYFADINGRVVLRGRLNGTPSGDGTRMAYGTFNSMVKNLYVAGAAARDPVEIVRGAFVSHNLEAVWSPDDSRIA